MTEQNKTKVPAELIPAGDYPVVSTDAVMDKQKGKTQEEVNEQIENNISAIEQVTSDKEYDSSAFSGLGRKNLRKNVVGEKNVLTQAMMSEANTIYVIQYDYDLNGQTITVPAGCVLQFEGGKISNGTIKGSNTRVSAEKTYIFNGVTFLGSWCVTEMYLQWFGGVADSETDNTAALQKAADSIGILSSNIRILPGSYRFNSSISIWKSNTNIIAEDGVMLNYYGKSHFFIIDLTDGGTHYNAARGTFVGGELRAYDVDCEDIFHIVYAPLYRFERIITRYGRNSFNTYFDGFAGIWYTYFIECSAQWAKENGFNIRSNNTGQVNQVSFFRCSAGSCGNPIYGTHTHVQDTVNGNGFDVAGTAITLMSCSTETNNGCGIKIRKETTKAVKGVCILNTYSEGNLLYPIYIGTGRDVFATSLYDRDGGKIECGFIQLDANSRNVFIPESFTKDQVGYITPTKSLHIANRTYREVYNDLMGLLLPAHINYKFRQGTGATYFFLTLGLYFDRNLLSVALELRTNFNNVEARTITSITDNIVKVDTPLNAKRGRLILISQEHPLYSLGQSTLLEYPIPVKNAYSDKGHYAAKAYGVTVNAGEDSFALTNDMIATYPSLKVGDVVYFYNNPEYTTLHTIGLANLNERMADIPLPTTLVGHPLEKSFCCMFTTNIEMDVVPFDFFAGYTIDQ